MMPRYKLLKANSSEELERKVNEAAEGGYEPYMGLVVGMALAPVLYQWVVGYEPLDAETIAAATVTGWVPAMMNELP